MNAIIIAAGSGKRISNNTKNIPKSMVRVNGKPIIEYQLSVLKKVGINDVYVVTGPYSEKFNIKNIKYVKDKEYEKHDILGSLMEAKNFFEKDTLVLYSDIIFELKIIEKIMNSKEDISIAVDMDWEKNYEGRTEHPISEAENVEIKNNTDIIRVKKNIDNINNNVGEFLGIIKFANKGSELFIKKYEDLVNNNTGLFHEAPSILKAYVTDMIQELINSNIKIKPILISGKWCEIDTMQDLKNAEKIFHF
ncbi:phosphocholine cytidylyltransferase family protein [Nitrosopumilus sp.]|jgi:choline kinase|nr:phosphocholine cytidylyltransferase family protein [Nitrosopumilus sp.]